jgi:hypothetical protein
MASMKNDLARQAKIAQDSQSSYEREVMAHSTSLNKVTDLKNSNETLLAAKEEAVELLRKSEEKLEYATVSFENTRTKLLEDVSSLEAR